MSFLRGKDSSKEVEDEINAQYFSACNAVLQTEKIKNSKLRPRDEVKLIKRRRLKASRLNTSSDRL